MGESSLGDSGESYQIHHLHQIVHSLRTQVTSIHHNVSSALTETFGSSWQPSNEAIWLLGHSYLPECEVTAASVGAGAHSLDDTASKDVVVLEAEQTASEGSNVSHGSSGSSSKRPEAYKPSAEFVEAWRQIMRLTYRKGFVPMYRRVRNLQGSASTETLPQYIRLTSDAGWGCMIRVGQMLLAAALRRHRERYVCPHICPRTRLKNATSALTRLTGSVEQPSTSDEADSAGQPSTCSASESWGPLEECFLDDTQSPLSIFQFIQAALGREVTAPPGREAQLCSTLPIPTRQLTKKDAGDWFGPTTISETIAALIERSPKSSGFLQGTMAVYINVDGMLYEEEVKALGSCDDCFLTPLGSPRLFAEEAKPRVDTAVSDDGFTVVSAAPELATEVSASMQLSEGSAPGPSLEFAQSSPEARQTREQCEEFRECNRTDGLWRRAVLLLFPLQLGLEKNVNELYMSCLLRYFELEASLGAMGGRPRMAHFFVGCQGRELLYVDPHVVQPAALHKASGEVREGSDPYSFRNLPSVQAIPIERIDSSISLAFYCCSDADLQKLVSGLKKIEEVEENVPVRSEPFRPLELRSQQVHRPWCDADSLSHDFSFSESPCGDSPIMLPMLSEYSSKAGNISRQSSFDLADAAICDPAESSVDDRSSQGPVVTAEADHGEVKRSKPKVSVGSAWSSIEAPAWQNLNQ